MNENIDQKLLEVSLNEETSPFIKVIGVGGGGNNIVNYMYNKGIPGVDFILCNTDIKQLNLSNVPKKIAIGQKITNGMGAGSNPEIGKQAAAESLTEIENAIKDAKMLFIISCFGGGTGTGATPVISKKAKDLDILTIAMIIVPFSFEGQQRRTCAYEGIRNLKDAVDALIIINNEKINEMHSNLPYKEAFDKANEILHLAVKGLTDIITIPGIINVDFADIKTILKNSGNALIGVGQAKGENKAIQSIENALNSPLLDNNDISKAKNILLNIKTSPTTLLNEIAAINQYIQNKTNNTSNIILGITEDNSEEDSITTILVATGLNEISDSYAEKKYYLINHNETNKTENINPQTQKIKEPKEYKEPKLIDQPLFEIDDMETIESVPAFNRHQNYKPHVESPQKNTEQISHTKTNTEIEINEINPYFRKKID